MKDISVETSRWKLVHTVLVLALSLVGVARQNFDEKEPSLFESFLIEAFAPIQRGTLSLKENVASMFDHYVLIINTSKNNEILKKEVSELKSQIFQLEEIKKENLRLKQLLDFGKVTPKKKVLAQIVSWDSSNEFKVVRINKGSNSGLKKMNPVITVNGLVGYVYKVTPNYSDILTILDQNNRVDAIVTRTRSHGVVEGTSDYKARLKYINRTEKIEVDDEIITAGLGSIYPKGIKVGRISAINKEDFGITQAIEITPSVDFYKLEEVVVLSEREHKAPASITEREER